jgi:2-methylcitrate dehydratase PrpD
MGKEMDCSVNVFEGKHGISQLYGKRNKQSNEIGLVITPVTQIQRVSIKPYPCCRLIHPCVDGILTLKNRHKFQVEEVEEVRIFVGKRSHDMVGHPFSPGDTPQVNAQFSIPYVCSVALINEKVLLNDFEENTIIKNQEVLEFTKKINVFINYDLRDQESSVPVRVEIKIKSGHLYEITVSEMLGSPDRPLNMEEIREKFVECVSHSKKKKLIRNIPLIEDTILNLEKVRDFSSVLDLLIEK